MHLIWTLASTFSLILHTAALLPTNLVYEFPNGTWLENLAVRPSGSILITSLTAPAIYEVNPLVPNPTAKTIHTFPDALNTLGITETFPDEFYVVTSNFSLKTLAIDPGSQAISRVKFPIFRDTPDVSLLATLPDAILLNGLTTLNPFTILAADSRKGVVWSIDTITGSFKIVISDPLMAPLPGPGVQIGINGIKIRGSTLYFTNTDQKLLAKIPINLLTGAPTDGPATIVAHAPNTASYDDFTLDPFSRNAFLATAAGDSIAEVSIPSDQQAVVAGMMGSLEIAEPTAARFGRTLKDARTLYVTTAGGLAAPVDGMIIGGQVVAVDVGS